MIKGITSLCRFPMAAREAEEQVDKHGDSLRESQSSKYTPQLPVRSGLMHTASVVWRSPRWPGARYCPWATGG